MRMNEKDDSKFEDELTAAAARLATEIKPDRDLWPGIEQAISVPAERRRTVWNTVWAQAAAVLLLVGGSSGITYLVMSGDIDPTSPVATNGTQLVFEPVSADFGSQYHLGPGYQDARRSLAANLEEELERLSPETRQDVVTNIETIRNAIVEINKALAEEPDNVLLQKLLLSAYREELALMQHVDSIANSAMYRGDI
jgi:hypothetical protein